MVDYILILKEKISKVSNKNKEERVNIEKDIAKKKDKIRKLCMQLHIGDEENSIDIKEYEELLKCKIHEDFIWCLKYFIEPDRRRL